MDSKPLNDSLKELGKFIATQLHLKGAFRLDQDSSLFHAMGFKQSIPFKKQSLGFILKILPIKLEVKYHNQRNNSDSAVISTKQIRQDVKLGFIHDTIKNCYLLESIKDEMKKSNNNSSQILSSKRFVDDAELVRFIANAAKP